MYEKEIKKTTKKRLFSDAHSYMIMLNRLKI